MNDFQVLKWTRMMHDQQIDHLHLSCNIFLFISASRSNFSSKKSVNLKIKDFSPEYRLHGVTEPTRQANQSAKQSSGVKLFINQSQSSSKTGLFIVILPHLTNKKNLLTETKKYMYNMRRKKQKEIIIQSQVQAFIHSTEYKL